MRKLLTLFVLLCTSTAFATINVQTTITPVSISGTAERAGIYQFSVESDEFANASFLNPVYIRLQLDKGAVWSETLVKSFSLKPSYSPIQIPVTLHGDTANTTINVPDYAVTIVRWKKGESSIWLKVASSSSHWVVKNGVSGPPSSATRAFITLGRTVPEEIQANEDLYDQGLASMIAPKRLLGGQVGDPLIVDLSDSTLQAAPLPPDFSLLNLVPTAYGPLFQKNKFGDLLDNLDIPSSIQFSNDTAIGIGVNFLAPKRGIYNLPSADHGENEVVFNNTSGKAVVMTLLPYDKDGGLMAEVTVEVGAHELQAKSMDVLFASSEVSHFQIVGSTSCKVGLAAGVDQGYKTVLNESGEGLQSWEIYPELMAKSGNMLSLVNLGERNASVTVEALDEMGQVLASAKWNFDGAFKPLSKQLVDLQAWVNGELMATRLRFTSSEKMSAVVLHQADSDFESAGRLRIDPVAGFDAQ